MKRFLGYTVGLLILLNSYGCIALLAGAAAGAGTAVWLSDKLTQTVNAPYDRTIAAAKSGLQSLKLEITKETRKEDVAQIKSKYTDGKEIWVDIRPVTVSSSTLEIRVGISGDKVAADKIMKAIVRYL